MEPVESLAKGKSSSGHDSKPIRSAGNHDGDKTFTVLTAENDPPTGSLITTEIEQADRQLMHVASKMLRITEMLSEDARSPGIPMLIVLSKTIPIVYAEYSKIHFKILQLVGKDDLKKEEEAFEKFEQIYYRAYAKVEEKMLSANNRVSEKVQRTVASSTTQQRPEIKHMPTGLVNAEWNAHNATKAVQYLISNWGNADVRKALVGSEDESVATSVSCQERYKGVLEILMGSANEKRILVETHIRGMANLRKMEMDSKEELLVLLNEITRHVDSLYYLEQEVTGVTEQFVVNLISSALSDSIRQSWEKTRTLSELSKLSEMIKFLRSLYPAKKPSLPSKFRAVQMK